jgi:hypothetical protein
MRWRREESRVNRLPRRRTITTNADPSLPLFALSKPPFALSTFAPPLATPALSLPPDSLALATFDPDHDDD